MSDSWWCGDRSNGACPCPWRARCRPTCREPCSGWGRRGRGCGRVRGGGAEAAAGGRVATERRWDGTAAEAGALHAVELRDGQAVSYLRRSPRPTPASSGTPARCWRCPSRAAVAVLALPGARGVRRRPDRAHRFARAPAGRRRRRVLFGVDDGSDGDGGGGATSGEGILLRIGEWDAAGALRSAQSVELERATWQHDIGVTAEHVVFIESPTTRLPAGPRWCQPPCRSGGCPGPKVARRGASRGGGRRWRSAGALVPARPLPGHPRARGVRRTRRGRSSSTSAATTCPKAGQPVDSAASVVGPPGIGADGDRREAGRAGAWRIAGERVERVQVDDR